MRLLAGLLGAGLGIILAGCSGSSIQMPPMPSVPEPVTHGQASHSAGTSVTFTVYWNGDARGVHARRAPLFLSPSAKSVELDVIRAGRSTASVRKIVNRAQHARSTTVTFAAPAGDDEFAFAVFDRSDARGDQIGGAQVERNVLTGRTTRIGATLAGYVANAALAPADGEQFVKVVHDGTGYPSLVLLGEARATLALTLEDADGNVIPWSRKNVPEISVSSSEPTLVAPAVHAGKGYEITLSAVDPNASQNSIVLSLHISSGGGAQEFSQSYTVTQEGLLYAAASGNPGSITIFDQHGKTYGASGRFAGLRRPISMAWDHQSATLFVADAGRAKIFAYDAVGHALAGWTPPTVPGVTSVTYNEDTRRVYATAERSAGASHDAVLAFDRSGAPVTVTGFAGAVAPVSIVYDNNAKVNQPANVDEFYLVAQPASGPTTVMAYLSNGAPAAVPSFSLGTGFTVTAASPYVGGYSPLGLVGGQGDMYCFFAAISGGTGTIGGYSDVVGLPPGFSDFKSIGLSAPLTAPKAVVGNPLQQWIDFYGPNVQPDGFYVANGTGGLVAIDGKLEQDTTYAFPPPSGATNFSALVMTY